MEDVWHSFLANNNEPPQNAFQLVNYSRDNTELRTLTYNEAKRILDKYIKRTTNEYEPRRRGSSQYSRSNKFNSSKRGHSANPSHKKSKTPTISLSSSSISDYDHHQITKLNKSRSHSNAAFKLNKPRRNGLKKTSSNPKPIQKERRKSNQRRRIKPRSFKEKKSLPLSINVGDHVLLTQDREGIILYIGEVHFAKGIWFGLELINGSIGSHDGIIGNKRYFKTRPRRGLFVQGSKIRRKMRDRDWTASPRQRRRHSLQQMSLSSSKSHQLEVANPISIDKTQSMQLPIYKGHRHSYHGDHNDPMSSMDVDAFKTLLRAEIETEFQTKFDELKKMLMEKQNNSDNEHKSKKRKHKSKKKKKNKRKKKEKDKKTLDKLKKMEKRRRSKSISNGKALRKYENELNSKQITNTKSDGNINNDNNNTNNTKRHGRTISLVSESSGDHDNLPQTPSIQITDASDFDDADIRYNINQQIPQYRPFWSLRK